MNKIYIGKNIKSDIFKKLVLSKYLNKYEIITNEDGKPYIKGNPIYFNVSHNGDYIVMIVSDKECGIDIQKITINNNVLDKILTDNEVVKTDDDFTKIWTKKEAYVKWTGKGLSYGLKNVDTTLIDINSRKYNDYYISYYVK